MQLGDCGRLLSIKEAAWILGNMSRDSIVRLIHNGEIEVFDVPRMGGRGINKKYLIPEREIIRLLERRTAKLKRIA